MSGYRGLKAALDMEPAAIVAAVTESGLRGRGGAAFPAGIKWKTVLGAERRSESTSSATPMRVTRALSPTAW
jgi:NADH:ubiquinone oxidoreductase subunit F (NADH-binding)